MRVLEKLFFPSILIATLCLAGPAGCSDDDEETSADVAQDVQDDAGGDTTADVADTSPDTEEDLIEPDAAPGIDICMITDLGGIADGGFNQLAWGGIVRAETELGVSGGYFESSSPGDYTTHIDTCIDEGSDLIITIGFLLADATATAAAEHPDQNFAIVDVAYETPLDNVLSLVFASNEAAFLAGYLAAGVTETDTVATFGAINIPPVTAFMDGFALGVDHYNEQNSTSVTVLGWDPDTRAGVFTGCFDCISAGQTIGETFIGDGADIIHPVAGPVGYGTVTAAQAEDNVYVIGVDSDWAVVRPEFSDVVLTSVLKNVDVAVFDAIEQVVDGTFSGGVYVGTLENGGVSLAPFHDLESEVPTALQTELDDLADDIIAGDVSTLPE
jgi:basic membrane protein A